MWAVTPDSFNTYELPKSSEIESATEGFRGAITDSLPVTEPAKANKLTKLSQIILAPVANQLGKKRLAIVGDGALQTIPFAALADPTIKAYQPLMVNHEIVNRPSMTAIATQRQRFNNNQKAALTLAVLADPIFDGNDERVTGKPPTLAPELNLNRSSLQRALKNIKRNGMARLKGTRAEALEILKLVPSQEAIYAYDFDANYSFVTNPELKKYRFLLFATHGIVDTTNPELSGIVLSQVDKQGKPVEKGYLRLGDIFNLDLGAELVVLSACDTGLGKDIKGEGLVGLTRGLMYAGSKRAVVSLWQVSDEGTSKLMPIFYKAVLQGKAPTIALREAQLQLWNSNEWKSPYYWAPFTLQGDWK
jgi:CHAT domain-containing protein